ncbi:MAG: PilZ domain-containing protein [Spirochaetota bacterium]|nr:PilZ domain-containing protein [Spirochaetota bacterium]
MKKKPLLIIVLSVIYILAPVLNLAFFSYMASGSLSIDSMTRYFNGLPSTLHKVNFALMFPLGGIAIYAVRKWSYPVFFVVTAWAIFGNLETMYATASTSVMVLMVAASLANFVGVGYILIPEVRKVYMDPALRWWETRPRYMVEIPSNNGNGTELGVIQDISEGGVFLIPASGKNMSIGDVLSMSFSFGGYNVKLKGEVVYHNPAYLKGYGIRFVDVPQDEKKSIKQLVKTVKKEGYERLDR